MSRQFTVIRRRVHVAACYSAFEEHAECRKAKACASKPGHGLDTQVTMATWMRKESETSGRANCHPGCKVAAAECSETVHIDVVNICGFEALHRTTEWMLELCIR